MKMHRFEVFIVDFEGYGIESYKTTLEQNDDYLAHVISHGSADIGEWDDDHELNSACKQATFMKYFKDKNESKD